MKMTFTKIWPPRFSRADASEYLSEKHGVKRTPGTLAKLAVVGGGPKFRKIGTRQVCYDRADLDDWVLYLIGKPFANTTASTLNIPIANKVEKARCARNDEVPE
jgi:hypothetical protein